MSTTLYRKYRPQTFKEVVAQNHIKITLQNEVELGKLAHAYLFSGPRGIGKTTVARILAKILNCASMISNEPCNNCVSCQEIKDARSLDLVEIDAASNRGIDEIRELREQTKYTPVKEKYKVFIIDEVHMLTTPAFNALLKTLEEPPAHAIFILATTEVHKIPDTIISRCQRFDFKKVPIQEIAKHLGYIAGKENINVDLKVLENIARLSEGYLRDALSLLGQVLSLGEKQITEKEASLVLPRSDWQQVMGLINNLLLKQDREAIMLVNKLLEEGLDFEYFIQINVESLRKLLLAKVTGDWQEVSWEFGEEWLKTLTENTKNVSANELVRMIEILIEAQLQTKKAKIVQLPLEIAIVKIIRGTDSNNNDNDRAELDEPSNNNKSSSGNTAVKPPVQNKAQLDVNQASTISNNSTNMNLNEIQNKWPEVIEALKSYNHSLASFIMAGKPQSLEDNKIILAFEFNFHCDRIKESKNSAIIHEVLEKVFKQKIILEAQVDDKVKSNILDDNQETMKPMKDEVIETVLEVFGGEVVN